MTAPRFKNKHTNSSPHLGWRPTPPERKAKIPHFSAYTNRMAAGVLPAEWDYSDSAHASFLQMLGNSQAGCCSITAVLKQAGLTSANRPDPKELVSNDKEALTQYPTICGRGDQGCYIPDVMDYWRDKGLMVGGVKTKILGYVSVNPASELEVAKALYLSGSLHAGLMISQKQYEEAAPDAVWDADNSPIVGGHSIPLAGRKKAGWRFGTWAMACFITQRALTASRAQTELYAVIDEQWFGQEGLNAFGVNVDKLKADLATIAAGGDVPIPDSPTPNPDPLPPDAPGTLTAEGSLEALGQLFPIKLAGQWTAAQAAMQTGSVNIWAVVADLAAIYTAARARDWVAAAAAVQQLLADLGLALSVAETEQFTKSLLAHAETEVIASGCSATS